MTQMNLSTKQTQIQRTDLWSPRERDGGGGMDWEFGVNRCKPLYRE